MDSKRRIAGWRETDKRIFAYQGDEKRSTAPETIIHKPSDQTDALTGAHIPKVILGHTRDKTGKNITYHLKDTMGAVKGPTGNQQDFVVSEPVKSTDTPEASMPTDTDMSQSGQIPEQLTLNLSQTTTYSQRDFLAKLSQLLESGEDSKILEAHSSLRYAESYGLRDLGFFSLKTSKGSSRMTEAIPFEPSWNRWMNLGMTFSGKCLTARISESRRTGSGCSLSDILEEHPDHKYFLSEKMAKGLLGHAESRGKKSHIISGHTKLEGMETQI